MTDLQRWNAMAIEETDTVWTILRNGVPQNLFTGTDSEAEFDLKEWHHQAWLDSGGDMDGADEYSILPGNHMPAPLSIDPAVETEYSHIPF